MGSLHKVPVRLLLINDTDASVISMAAKDVTLQAL